MSNNHPPHLPPPPAGPPPPPGPPPPYPPSYQPPGGGPSPRRTPWLLVVGAAVLAAVLVAGVAIAVVLVTRDDDDPTPVGRTTETIPPTTELSSVTAPTEAVTTAPPVTTRDAILGTWIGVYVCAQGDTRLRLTIDRGPGPADLTAVFAFGPTEDNPAVPRGSYRMRGTLSEGLLRLHATTWIKKPAGYVPVDIEASVVGEEPPHILGDIIDVPQCSTFAVGRAGG